MLSIEKRPKTWDEVVGQDSAVRLLKSVVKNAKEAPRCIILQGPFGTGKTTLGRIFASALNKNLFTGPVDASPFYSEFDSSAVGNVATIRELRDSFHWSGEGYRVFLFDEMQLSSKQAQSALLKVIEEVEDNCFFMFATTDPQDLLPTIISRSLVVPLNLIPDEALRERLDVVISELNVNVSEDVRKLIVEKAHGHGRNLMMLLDNYLLLGEEHFHEFLKSSVDIFVELFVSIFNHDLTTFKKCIDDLQTFSLSDLNSDYNVCVSDILKGCVGAEVSHPEVNRIVNTCKPHFVRLARLLRDNVVTSCFTDPVSFMSGMYFIYGSIAGVSR